MRRIAITGLALVLSLGLMGCPPADTKTNPPTDGGDKPVDGGDKPVDSQPTGDTTGDKPSGEPEKVDISHVKVGQKYKFKNNPTPDMSMEMIYKVKEIKDNAVVYDIISIMGGNEMPATEMKWDFPVIPTKTDAPPAEGPKMDISYGEMEVSGVKFQTMVVKGDHGTSTTPLSKGSKTLTTFPGVLEMKDPSGRVTMKLEAIEN